MIDHAFVGPMGMTGSLLPDTPCYAIVRSGTSSFGPICKEPLRLHGSPDLTEEELMSLWRRSHVIAGHPQTSYPPANVLTEFVTLLRETSRSRP